MDPTYAQLHGAAIYLASYRRKSCYDRLAGDFLRYVDELYRGELIDGVQRGAIREIVRPWQADTTTYPSRRPAYAPA